MKRKFINILIISVFIFLASYPVFAQEKAQTESQVICGVYISGIGCGNCAIADPILFLQWTARYPDLVFIEYEIYRLKEENKDVKEAYFLTYLPFDRPGVPFLTFGKTHTSVGRIEVLKADEYIKSASSSACPLPYGGSVDFDKMDLANLPGKAKIWTKNRVLIPGKNGDNTVLRKLIEADNLPEALADIEFKQVKPEPVAISRGEINFQYAVLIGDWRIQWNGKPVQVTRHFSISNPMIRKFFAIIGFLGIFFLLFRIRRSEGRLCIEWLGKSKWKERAIAIVSIAGLVAFFYVAKNITPDFLKQMGYAMPLPLFTAFIALVDGFNPCNMFVLTCLLALLISTSDSRKRLFAVALSFVFVVFVIYFLFMAAWLNVFKYISFIDPLRIAIAIIALVAGIINCKELIFFKKGISLTISEEHKEPLMEKMRGMKQIIQSGSFPLLISSSVGLAALASLVELPCTAGFPIIYTGILSGKVLESTFSYYAYLIFYNAVYVVPLLVIIAIFVFSFRAKAISKRQIQIIKFIGGLIMILLGIVLLVNPHLIGLGIG